MCEWQHVGSRLSGGEQPLLLRQEQHLLLPYYQCYLQIAAIIYARWDSIQFASFCLTETWTKPNIQEVKNTKNPKEWGIFSPSKRRLEHKSTHQTHMCHVYRVRVWNGSMVEKYAGIHSLLSHRQHGGDAGEVTLAWRDNMHAEIRITPSS